MEFKIDTVLPATPAQLWAIFFDMQRVAALIPGCEAVTEIEPLKEFSAVMKQKIGPFRLEVPTGILIDSYAMHRQVVIVAAGIDKVTDTANKMRMNVDIEDRTNGSGPECRLEDEAKKQETRQHTSLGYPIVKKRSE